MKRYNIVFTPEAEEELASIYNHLADTVSAEIAKLYTNSILLHCESFTDHPLPGTARDDIRPGVKITTYQGGTVIAYVIESNEIVFIGFFYGKQDYVAALRTKDSH